VNDATARIGAVFDFWFGAPGDPENGTWRKAWFVKDPSFDASIADRFRADVDDAVAGRRDDWAETPHGALALLILLDQFPRNLHRGSALAFAGDDRARRIADAAIARGLDRELGMVERVFIYLPFEHSENEADQARSVALFDALKPTPGFTQEQVQSCRLYARKHQEIVVRFGRFPHRNAALGRATTAEEAAFLLTPGSSF
jgi:uncharacterized protein (DUF924 family)